MNKLSRLLHFALSSTAAFLLYQFTLAPGLTWAHHGADGGELIAAAMVRGVPHPPGYPLYTLLLRYWLQGSALLLPQHDPAWHGNLLSAFFAALSVGLTVLVVAHLLRDQRFVWGWAYMGGLAWAISPLPWSQAVITEVYALHILAFVLLGWVLLVHEGKPLLLGLAVALGFAHHLTFLLLLPATLYYCCWVQEADSPVAARRYRLIAIGLGILAGMAFYLRIPLAAGGGGTPPPVNWGYADNWSGFWWLVSGSAYRAYLFGGSLDTLLGRLAAWSNVLTTQLTFVGLGLGIWGLSYWDEYWPSRRTFSLLWVVPVALYSLVYYTRDSDIYLLPVVWMLVLWAITGLWVATRWVESKRFTGRAAPVVGIVALVALLAMAAVRGPAIAAHDNGEAERFVADALTTIEPASIVITNEDTTTFALWYAAWGNGTLFESTPDVVLVNHALYQFDWYRRLLGNLYPNVPAVDLSVEAMLTANRDLRPVYFSEKLPSVPEERLSPAGPLWRYHHAKEQP